VRSAFIGVRSWFVPFLLNQLGVIMFRVKICGVTNIGDAMAVAEAGADAVGLNFYPKSPRWVEVAVARAIVEALPPGIVKVGVFVNADVNVVCETADRARLDLIQLHGDETPEYLAALATACPLPIMRAFRLSAVGLTPILDYLDQCRRLRHPPLRVLLDAYQPGMYGGTGETADWGVAARYVGTPGVPPLVLAGGLTPTNVAPAIAAVHPAAVDTAGGVESSPGRKDPALVREFVRAARDAFTTG
jgi:phosphoribosylanthranilate isomerase